MSIPMKRIAVNFGGGFVPGLNAVVTGTVLAAHELGWEVVGIRDLRQSSSNYLQESTNRRLNVLAVLSAIYLPATLVAGIYGMNFENIPITNVPYGYVIVLALMIGLVIGQIWFFYRRGYFR